MIKHGNRKPKDTKIEFLRFCQKKQLRTERQYDEQTKFIQREIRKKSLKLVFKVNYIISTPHAIL